MRTRSRAAAEAQHRAADIGANAMAIESDSGIPLWVYFMSETIVATACRCQPLTAIKASDAARPEFARDPGIK